MSPISLAALAAALIMCPISASIAETGASATHTRTAHVERAVVFPTADGTATLGGTLTLPLGNGPYPAAVFLSVAGPNDRDQAVGDLRGFRDLAHYLAAQGIASLRFDDRGVGSSTGHYFAASWQNMAEDAAEAYDVLTGQPAINPARIGFLGMSQGAALGAMATRLRPKSAFIVLLSAPGLSGREALRGQLETMMGLGGISGSTADGYRATFEEFLEIVTKEPGDPAVQRQRMLAFLAGPGRQLIPPYSFVPKEKEALADMLLGSWYASTIGFDPKAVYGALTVPVLAIAGGRDVVAPATDHLSAIRALLREAPQMT